MNNFTRTTKVSGDFTLDDYANVPISISFEYGDSAPEYIQFNFRTPDNVYSNGQFNGVKINNYSVNGSVVDNNILTALQTKLAELYKNYKTI